MPWIKSPYKMITVSAKPQDLELILDDDSETNKEIKRETDLAHAAPELLLALQGIATHAGLSGEYARTVLEKLDMQTGSKGPHCYYLRRVPKQA